MANAASTFKQNHHYATGIIFVAVGVFGMLGAITGGLANMLAALWVPDALVSTGKKPITINGQTLQPRPSPSSGKSI